MQWGRLRLRPQKSSLPERLQPGKSAGALKNATTAAFPLKALRRWECWRQPEPRQPTGLVQQQAHFQLWAAIEWLNSPRRAVRRVQVRAYGRKGGTSILCQDALRHNQVNTCC